MFVCDSSATHYPEALSHARSNGLELGCVIQVATVWKPADRLVNCPRVQPASLARPRHTTQAKLPYKATDKRAISPFFATFHSVLSNDPSSSRLSIFFPIFLPFFFS